MKVVRFPFEEVGDYAINARNEYLIIKQFESHPNFVQVLGFHESKTMAKLVMEKLNGFTV